MAVLCIIGWRVLWLTMVNRVTPEASAEVAFTKTEIKLLDRIAASTKLPRRRTITHYLTAVAKLGGYLAAAGSTARKHGALTGLTRLTDIHLGFELRNKLVGN